MNLIRSHLNEMLKKKNVDFDRNATRKKHTLLNYVNN